MTGRWLPFSFAGLTLSLIVFGFFTGVPALLAYPLSLVVAASVGGLSFCLRRNGKR